MRRIGFSSGALAYADFRSGVSMLTDPAITVLELSALRENELRPMLEGIDELDLSQFDYVAVHAPSQIAVEDEPEVIEMLSAFAERGWPIVLHPDAAHDFSLWRRLGPMLCIENMDKRKPLGRTPTELAAVFEKLPEARLCFDIGHARQVDSSMTEAYFILTQFGDRLCQVHMSEVNTRSKHDPLSYASILAYREVSELIPENIPIILESPVPPEEIQSEIEKAREALPVAREEAVLT